MELVLFVKCIMGQHSEGVHCLAMYALMHDEQQSGNNSCR
jgi:hypothetical protein